LEPLMEMTAERAWGGVIDEIPDLAADSGEAETPTP
jgi:hypothetical protein